MAKGKGEVVGWITRNGVHVPIYGDYTVRGGVEPKAKGSKFKGGKKRIKELGDRLREKKSIGYKDLEEYMNQPGSTLEANYRDWRGGESFYVTNKDDDGDGIKVTAAAANKYIEKNGDSLNSERNGGEYQHSYSKKSNNAATEGESDASKGKRVEGKGAVKDVNGKKPEMYDWKQDRTDTQEERDAFAKEHEQGIKDRLAKINEQNKPKGKEETFKGSVLKKSDEKGEGYDWKKDRIDEPDSKSATTQKERAAQKEQESSTPDFSKMSYGEVGKYVSEHKKDFGLKPEDDAYQAAYEMKQGTWKGQMSGQESSMKDSYSQETFGKNYSELNNDERQHVDEWAPKEKSTNTSKNLVSTTESYPWTKSFGSSEPSASEYGKALESISKGYDSENRTVPGKEMGKVFEDLKPGDKIQVHNTWSVNPNTYTVNEDGTIDYSTPSSAFLGKKGMSLAEAQKHATNSVDNRITVMRRKTGQTSSKGGSAKEAKGSIPTTVSGLRSAYSEATGSEKAAIASELRRKGYSLVGGKWIKA